jgi:hypothetical protein
MTRKNNYRETILHLKAQRDRAIEYLKELDPTKNWTSILEAEGYDSLTPEYRETHIQQAQAKARANLKPNVGRRPPKKILVGGQEKTYKELAQERGVTIATVRNQIWKQQKTQAPVDADTQDG